jgi:hypothetical protein
MDRWNCRGRDRGEEVRGMDDGTEGVLERGAQKGAERGMKEDIERYMDGDSEKDK